VLFPISLIVSCVFAAGSWHFIEKPTLKLKKILPLIELRWRRRSEPRPVTEKDSATPDAAREVDPIRRTTGVEI
jgi:peptidoglycan/LPS O-acetylase OafA/YrhL